MLDIKFIRENAELVQKKAEQKGYSVDVKNIIEKDDQRRELLQKAEQLRAKRNELADGAKGAKPSPAQIEQGKQLKDELSFLEHKLEPILSEFDKLLFDVPNIFPDDTPLGGEKANREERKWGDTAKKDFAVKDHVTWAESKGLLDFERGAKVAGNKFYFTKGPLVDLEMAILAFGLEIAKKHKFIPMTVPNLVSTRVSEGTGYSARGKEPQVYKVEGEELNLIATAEVPLTGYHADEILQAKELPKLYAGISPAYRLEAGAYGKHAKGLYRVHQFNKVELYVYCQAEESEAWHQKMVAIEEEICQQLNLPYRVVRIAAGDLGAPAHKKYDVEYWSPVDGTYRELMSCSNVTDYQARRLNIRYKDQAGKTHFAHTLNGTAAAASRLLIAIIENYQSPEGKISLPKALHPYMGGQTSI